MKKSILALSLAAAFGLNAAVLATVDGNNVTDDDLLPLVGGKKENLNRVPADVKKKMIDGIIGRKLMLKEAKSSDIESDAEYKKALEALKDDLALDVWIKKQADAIKIGDADIKAFYDKNKDKFIIPAQVRARHILVQNQKEADDVLKALKGLKGDALTAKFSELANSKSIDKSTAKNGGELGWFGKSQMVPEFGDAAFALQTGELSKAVKSQFGYHVILKEDAKAQNVVPYDKVKDDIAASLRREALGKEMDAKVNSLRSKAKIEYK